jgi:squalene-hopene/tetraprenyl-beta-curcumene cyclase
MFSFSINQIRRVAVRRLCAIFTLIVLPISLVAADPAADVKTAVNRGLSFLAKDNLAWKEKRKCAECHHAPFTIWALNEGKKQGYAVDEKALAEMITWVLTADHLAKLVAKPPKEEKPSLNEAPLLLALGLEAGETKGAQDGLKKILASVLSDQEKDGSWKLWREFRPIGSSPDTLTSLSLLALSAPNAPDLGKESKGARDRAIQWLRAAKSDGELQADVLRLIVWKRLGLPASEWEPLLKATRASQNSDGGWGQTRKMKSDAYATGQALYALAEAGVRSEDEGVRKAQAYLVKSQRADGAWAMDSRAILSNGKPATNFEPITHAGSAWAVMGLARSAPVVARPGSATSK